MPNDFFQFKQFRINQGQCAMKVTTEGCLFGAAIKLMGSEKRILDVGAGTGLLSLMLAQRCEARIDAVEIDEESAEQAQRNFGESPWSERLRLFQEAIQDYCETEVFRYDLIVSNPPFFTKHLQSGKTKDRAIHADTLPQADLIEVVDRLLLQTGRCWVIYPSYEFEQFRTAMGTKGWYVEEIITVHNRPRDAVFRMIGAFSKMKVETNYSEVFIRDEQGAYSREFSELLADYYL